MLVVLSPAKKLDFDSEWMLDAESQDVSQGGSQPRFMDDTALLVEKARGLRAGDLMQLMGISQALADLNVNRFKAFDAPFTPANARYALDAFKGDVYVGLDAPSMDADDRAFANDHLRILSGLYGLLRPLDLMQAYRLEMGVKFANVRGDNLYQFWGDQIATALRADMDSVGDPVLVNLASTEYFKSVRKAALGKDAVIITPAFKEIKDGRARVISFLAKKARGAMARYAVDNRITDASALKDFGEGGYRFDADQSTDTNWVFSRAQP